MHKFLWADVETTGLDPKKHVLHQIAGHVVINGITVEEFNFEMVPHPDAEIQEEALRVSYPELTGPEAIAKVMSRDKTSEQCYEEFRRMVERHVNKYDKEDKFVFCAYNADFDAQHTNGWFNRHNNPYFFGLCHGGAYFDPLNLALMYEMKVGKKIFRPNRKLATVCEYFGVPLDNTHDAMSDIVATRTLGKIFWERLIGKA